MIDANVEDVAKQAFTHMDTQIDLWMHEILSLTEKVTIGEEDYLQGEFSDIWKEVPDHKSCIVNERMYYKSGTKLFL